jgi:D-alanyl-D-alanine carboxypeptidase
LGREVTIAELLSHTSGIADYLNSEPSVLGPNCPSASVSFAACPSLAPAQVVSWLARQPLQFPPGTQFSYSNSNYYLLGLVIEHVTGQSYSSYLENQLLRPLGLSHTAPCPDEMRPPSHAVGYYVGIGSRGAVAVGTYPFASEYFAAGELCSTVGDLVKWANDLASGRVVSPSTYDEMTTPGPLPGEPFTPYGYGLLLGSVDGQAWVGHNGATSGFNSWLLHFPGSDLSLAICLNADPVSVSSTGLVERIESVIEGDVLSGTEPKAAS